MGVKAAPTKYIALSGNEIYALSVISVILIVVLPGTSVAVQFVVFIDAIPPMKKPSGYVNRIIAVVVDNLSITAVQDILYSS
jgi:hypothetical protein